jgi:hypothetical protein
MGEERGQRDLESKIAEFVRTYAEAARGDDSSQEQEALRWLCSGLERLLQRRLLRDLGQSFQGSFLDRSVLRYRAHFADK